ncbi:hypothetical protein PQX77_010618 [Marasmius sp. AFHP31]|nr:hypothetical protein PQX77_010618 [Marasmius sp. AFHP31]
MSLSCLPPELSSRILSICNAKDLASFSQASVQTHDLIYSTEDQCIWRSVFLNTFDDPRRAVHPRLDFDWKKELQRRTTAQSIAFSSSNPEGAEQALKVFIDVVNEALPATADEDSENISWLDNLLLQSKFLDTFDAPLSHLHALVNISHEETAEFSEERELLLRDRRTNSRFFVYDLQNYRSETGYAPFTGGSTTNWVHINHLIHVVLMNLREVPTLWGRRPPLGLEATRAYSAPGLRDAMTEDWAGVEGLWRSRNLHLPYFSPAFNNSTIGGGPRSRTFFQDTRFREATRLIEVKLHLVARNQLKVPQHLAPESSESSSSSSSTSSRPTLYFTGTSRGNSGNEATIEGSVSIGKDGCVRWHFVSTVCTLPFLRWNRLRSKIDLIQATMYDGVTQWCSQGVQIGNIGSAAGVVGNWTTSLHEEDDPVGPFWLWKVEEDSAPSLVDFT